MIDRHAILTTLATLIGVPFCHQGRTRSAGLDCLGVIMFVAKEHGIPLEDMHGYPAATDGMLLRQECQRQLVEIPMAEAVPADVVQWAEPTPFGGKPRPPCNLALLGWENGHVTMIHAMVRYAAVMTHDYVPPWPRLVRWAYQFPGVGPWLPRAGEMVEQA
jgi:hypothetical protein